MSVRRTSDWINLIAERISAIKPDNLQFDSYIPHVHTALLLCITELAASAVMATIEAPLPLIVTALVTAGMAFQILVLQRITASASMMATLLGVLSLGATVARFYLLGPSVYSIFASSAAFTPVYILSFAGQRTGAVLCVMMWFCLVGVSALTSYFGPNNFPFITHQLRSTTILLIIAVRWIVRDALLLQHCFTVIKSGFTQDLVQHSPLLDCCEGQSAGAPTAVIKSILLSLQSMSNVLSKTELTETQREHVEVMRKCVKSLEAAFVVLQLQQQAQLQLPVPASPFRSTRSFWSTTTAVMHTGGSFSSAPQVSPLSTHRTRLGSAGEAEYGGTGADFAAFGSTDSLSSPRSASSDARFHVFDDRFAAVVEQNLVRTHTKVQSNKLPMGRVLICDDNQDCLFIYQSFLRGTPYIVDYVDNGAEAVAKFVSERYDLVLLDLEMPGLDGIQAAQQMHQHASLSRFVPIVALTVHSFEDVQRNCIRAKFTGYIGKPVSCHSFINVIAQFLVATHDIRRRLQVVPRTPPTPSGHSVYPLKHELHPRGSSTTNSSSEESITTPATMKHCVSVPSMQVVPSVPPIQSHTSSPITRGIAKPPPHNRRHQSRLTAVSDAVDMPSTDFTHCGTLTVNSPESIPLASNAVPVEIYESLEGAEHASPVTEAKAVHHVRCYAGYKDMAPEYAIARAEEMMSIPKKLLDGEFEQIRADAHKLKGTAPCFGMTEIAEEATTLMEAALRHDAVAIQKTAKSIRQYLQTISWEFSDNYAA